MGRKWTVEVEGKQYVVEARYGGVVTTGSGQLLVDGKVVDTWGGSLSGLPKERTFQIAGKKAILRRTGVIQQNLELSVEGGKVIRM
jgi:hypothetical protein